MRVAFAGGGTGGHIVPGIHLLEYLSTGDADALSVEDLVWFTSGRGVEERVFEGLTPPCPWQRVTLKLERAGGGAPGPARLILSTPRAILAARRALKAHDVQVLLGLGGFTTMPVVLAARSLGIPIAMLEINAVSGRATRFMSGLAQRVFHAWKGTLPGGQSDRRHQLVGAPVAPSVTNIVTAGEQGRAAALGELGFDQGRPLLLVLGGSQGAGSLNQFVQTHARWFLDQGLQILHQCGPGRRAEAPGELPGLRVVEYLSPMASALQAASLVLCRGGASTLAEVAASQRAAVVIPYPHHPDQHQERNARELGQGVQIVKDADLNQDLAERLVRLLSTSGASEREALEVALGQLGAGQACARILEELQSLAAEGPR